MIEDRPFVYFFLILNLIVAIRFYIKNNCEVPLFMSIFNIFVEYRIISIKLGLGDWVVYDYGIDLKFNFDIAYAVSNLILMGSSILIYSFILFYKPTVDNKLKDSDTHLKKFILTQKNLIIIGLVFFTAIQFVLRNGANIGYAFLGKLGNTSFIILLFLLFIYTDNRKVIMKVFYLGIFLILSYLTFTSLLRFQFLGWTIPIGYYLVRNVRASRKLIFMVVGVFLIMLVFSLVRALDYQSKGVKELSNSELVGIAFQRILVSDDINFIDGFIMMYQIYPRYLDFDYGLEHLDIIFRPVPRSLWPGKPLAGWFQEYAAKYKTTTKLVGFSPTLYGVFYAEGGEVGIVIFSVFWAWALFRIYQSFRRFNSILGPLSIGILLAALVPIMRSGDLAGDFAIVFMSYWPLIIFVRRYKKYVARENRREALKQLVV